MYKETLTVLLSAWLAAGQRPSFAGTQPIGFPALTDAPKNDALGNRFGGDDLPLPLEAKGDRDLVQRISQMPLDKQPFWYINWKALEEQRKNPQTYQPKPNSFVNSGSGTTGTQNNPNPQGNGLTSKSGDNSNTDNQNQNYYGNRGGSRQHYY